MSTGVFANDDVGIFETTGLLDKESLKMRGSFFMAVSQQTHSLLRDCLPH